MTEVLPRGWSDTTLGAITAPSGERADPAEVPTLPYVGLEHVEAQTMRLLGHGLAADVRSSSIRFSKGDVLYGKMRPYLNKVWVAEFEGICSGEFLVFETREGLSNDFLALRLNADDFVQFANGQVSGERPRVDFDKLATFAILLPPAAEQLRIVAKASEAIAAIRRGEIATRRAQVRLKTYCDAVLNAAVAGELTAAWREAQSGNRQDGEGLLNEILLARRSRWEEARWARAKSGRARGAGPAADYRPPSAPNPGNLSEPPNGWTWATLDQLSILVTSGSRGWKEFYAEEGALFIRSQDIRTDQLSLAEIAHVQPPHESEGTRTRVERGDVLVTITGANVGKAALVESELKEAYVSQHVALIRLVQPELSSFVHRYITAPEFGRKLLSAAAYGAGKPGLNLQNLRELPVLLAPLSEQTQIVVEVKRRLAAADRLSRTLEEQLTRARSTREALLREAFAGRLVPQNSTDEPASVLLNRLRNLGARPIPKTRGKRMSRQTSTKDPVPRQSLLAVLKEHKAGLSPEALFSASGHSQETVDQFFAELRDLTAPPAKIGEERQPGGLTLLRALS